MTDRRAVACTASLFALFVGLIAAGFLVRVPHTCWFDSLANHAGIDTPLIMWVLPNIGLPIVGLVLAGISAVSLWNIASLCCRKLRGL